MSFLTNEKDRQNWLFTVCAIGLLVIYAISIKIGFLFDDSIHIFQAAFMPENQKGTLNLPMHHWKYRPILQALYWFDFKTHGYNLWIMHLENCLFHGLNMLLAYKLFFKGYIQKSTNSILLKLLFLSLFFHPILWHSVFYLSARSAVISVFFTLLSIDFYKEGSKTLILSLLFWIMAIFVKETGVLALPIAMLLYPEVSYGYWKKLKSQKILLTLLSLAGISTLVSCYFLFYRYLVLFYQTLSGERNNPYNYLSYIYTQSIVFYDYLIRLIFPLNWQFLYDPKMFDKGDISGLLAFILTIVLLLFILFKIRKDKKVFSLFLAALLSMAPELIYPRAVLAQDQRCYLFFILIFALFTLLITRIEIKSKFSIGLLSVVAVSMMSLTVQRGLIYQDENAIYQRAYKSNPYSYFAVAGMLRKHASEGRIDKYKQVLEQFLNQRLVEAKNSFFLKKIIQNYVMNLHGLALSQKNMERADQLEKVCHEYQMHKDICQLLTAKNLKERALFQQALSALDLIENKKSITVAGQRVKIYSQLKNKAEAQRIVDQFNEQYGDDPDVIKFTMKHYLDFDETQRFQEYVQKQIESFKETGENELFRLWLEKQLSIQTN